MRSNTMKAWCGLGLALVCSAAGCNGEKKEDGGGEKAAYETAVKEVADMVGLIAAYRPYLKPVRSTAKYANPRRPDLDKGATQAGNYIRSAANRARQKADSSTSKITMGLKPAFVEVLKACTNAEDEAELDKCDQSVTALDKELEKAAAGAQKAGVTAKFPRVAVAFITAAAQTEATPFIKAMGGGPAEKSYEKLLEDAKAEASAVVGACRAAVGEADVVLNEVQKVGEDIRKIAVHHKLAIDAHCNNLARAEVSLGELPKLCDKKRKKPAKDEPDECMPACARCKGVLNRGVPAAAFEAIPKLYEELCEEGKK